MYTIIHNMLYKINVVYNYNKKELLCTLAIVDIMYTYIVLEGMMQ